MTPKVISVPYTGTNFTCYVLEQLGFKRPARAHVTDDLAWRDGLEEYRVVVPLRHPVLSAITHMGRRVGNDPDTYGGGKWETRDDGLAAVVRHWATLIALVEGSMPTFVFRVELEQRMEQLEELGKLTEYLFGDVDWVPFIDWQPRRSRPNGDKQRWRNTRIAPFDEGPLSRAVRFYEGINDERA